MKINQKYNGSIIGAIATLISLLLMVTIYIPILATSPAFILKSMLGGYLAFFILFIFLIFVLFKIFTKARQTQLTNLHMTIIMAVAYVIIHPLSFLIYWWIDLGFRGDGQIVVAVFLVYPLSSFGLALLGILIDIVKNKYIHKHRSL